MQKVLYISEVRDYASYIDPSVIEYITDEQVETYESFADFDLVAFDWYDIHNAESEPSQILVYLDRDDLFYLCENNDSYRAVLRLFVEDTSDALGANERALYLFFRNLYHGSAKFLEDVEARISILDDDVANGTEDGLIDRIVDMRNEILMLKKYYEQLEFLFEEICDKDNDLISPEGLRYFENLHNRSLRTVAQVVNLREYLAQVRDAYQSQIGIEQNDVMRVFTMVTSIFLPLTLIVGWYGMNLKMPEFGWTYGYPLVIGLMAIVSLLWYAIFKRHGWFR